MTFLRRSFVFPLLLLLLLILPYTHAINLCHVWPKMLMSQKISGSTFFPGALKTPEKQCNYYAAARGTYRRVLINSHIHDVCMLLCACSNDVKYFIIILKLQRRVIKRQLAEKRVVFTPHRISCQSRIPSGHGKSQI